MTYPNDPNTKPLPYPASRSTIDQVFPTVMRTVYLWMFLGLTLTAIVAVFVVRTPAIMTAIYSRPFLLFGLVIGQLAVVIALSAAINRISPSTALLLFFLYAGLNGVTFASIFIVYDLGQVALAFIASASLFAAMGIIGYTTKKDLSGWGWYLFFGLLALIIASVVNIFLASSALDWLITYAGILLFLGLTIYDTQSIRKQTERLLISGDETALGRMGVFGALRLYLDFINLFLMILRLTRR